MRRPFVTQNAKHAMEGKNNGKWYLWFVVPIAALTTWKIFRNTARGANRVTEDMTDSEAQAAKFYGLFGVKIVAGVAFATPVIIDATLKQIGWLARNINDWAVVQRAFTTLCGGNYTILQAASTALNTTNYNGFVTLISQAQKQPRIFCGGNDATTLYNANQYGGVAAENFKANTFVGRCTAQDDMYYYYVSWQDGCTYQAPKDSFILK